jgi:hypothetical protein
MKKNMERGNVRRRICLVMPHIGYALVRKVILVEQR